MKFKYLAYLLIFVISNLFLVSIFSTKVSAQAVCTDNSLVTGCPTCTCPQSGKQYFQEALSIGSIQAKVMYLESVDVTNFFNPTVESQKGPNFWFYGPYDGFNPDGSGSCPASGFGLFAKTFTCKLPQTNESCGYARGSGAGQIKLNCINGPFTAKINYPQGYFPISGPVGASGNSTEARNINICGQIAKTVTWNVGYLNAPTNVACGQVTSTELRVDWTAVDGATSYEVYRDGNLIGTVTTNSFSNKGLDLNTTYKYKVKAIKEISQEKYESPLSNETTCTTGAACSVPSKPTGTSATTTGPSSVDVRWNASTGQVDGYNLLRWDSFLNVWDTVNGSTLIVGNSYLDSDPSKLVCGTTYTYKVEAVGCDYKVESNTFTGQTDACPQAASCSGILGPDKVEINQSVAYTVNSSGAAPLHHQWTLNPNVGNITPPSQKNVTYVAPNTVPIEKGVTINVRVWNNTNPGGFICTKSVDITPVLGKFEVEVKKVSDCSSALGSLPAPDINVGLYADESTGYFWYPQDTSTNATGIATFTPEIPGDQPYIAKLPVSRLNSLVLEACPGISNGWTKVSEVWENTQTLTLSNREVRTPPLYVTTLSIPPSFAKWTSINQGNITVRNSFSTKGLASDYLIKFFGTAFIKGSQFVIEVGNFGPVDLTQYKAYLFREYDNELNISQIVEIIGKYEDADIKDCTDIHTKTYDTSKGVLKFRSNTASPCVINIDSIPVFELPAFSVIFIDGDLNIRRNMINDALDNSVLVVTGDIKVGENVTIIDLGLLVGGNLTVDAPIP